MNKEYKITVGIETHCQLNTKTKMFSNSKCCSDDSVNKYINEYDIGLPGSLPTINKGAVIKALRLAKALNMKVNTDMQFDRKNYFYQDLPKGFQITQFYKPIAYDGKVKIGDNKYIDIEKFHLEEDTAKQHTDGNLIYLNYNRSGIPLIEMVTKPCMHSKDDVLAYLKELKRLLIFLDVSDGEMENASLRVDLNISISPNNSLGTKVEIKNINSIKNVADAIDYEFKRQSELLDSGKKVEQETRRFDDKTCSTIFMRGKGDAVDYRYFTEPNIIKIDISELNKYIDHDKILMPDDIANKLKENGIPDNIIKVLMDDIKLLNAFNYVNNKVNDVKATINWVVVELISIIKTSNNIDNATLDLVIDMINSIKNNEINGKQGKTIIAKIVEEKKSIKQLIKELGFQQITNEAEIERILISIIDKNKPFIDSNIGFYERVSKFIIGQLMKETGGQANPIIAANVLNKLLKK